jgi:signal transduction histidine kinase
MDLADRIAELEAHNARLTEIVADAAELMAELEQRRAADAARVRQEQEEAELRLGLDATARASGSTDELLERLAAWFPAFAPIRVRGASARLGTRRYAAGDIAASADAIADRAPCKVEHVFEVEDHVAICLGEADAGPGGILLRVDGLDDAWRQRWMPTLRSAGAQLSATFQRRNAEESNRRLLIEMTRARAFAEEANRAKSSFLASVSHELRTPLNVIIGYAELMLQDAEAQSRDQDIADLSRIIDAGAHLLSMIDDILDFTRLEAGRIPMAKDVFDPYDLAAEVCRTVAPTAALQGTPVQMEKNGECLVTADRSRVRQVLQNLIGTAARLAPGGRVAVSLTVGKHTEFAIDVDGHDLSNGQVTTLFEPLNDAHSWEGRRFGCTGLGTAISRALILAMGGTIVATTRPHGFRIVATLPLALARVPAPA